MEQWLSRQAAGRAAVALATILATTGGVTRAQPATTPTHKIRIVLAGDSTVTDNAGWGHAFADCFGDGVEVINLSKGGRASGSFVKEGRWQKALDAKPDYVLVQFGHNDQPGHGPERETDPNTTYKANLARYVDEGRAAGTKVVLVTPMSRREWGDDNKIHSRLQPWVDATKQVAAEKNVPIIDLHSRAIELYEKLGRDGVLAISPGKAGGTTQPVNGDNSGVLNKGYDGTHLNATGARMVGPIVARGLIAAVPALADVADQGRLAAPLPGKVIVVAADGSGMVKTVQEALDAVPEDAADRTLISVKPGTYAGPFIVPKTKRAITLVGEDSATTILAYDKNVYDPIPAGHDKFNPGLHVRGDDFRAENITFTNTSGDHGQALAVRVDGDKASFKNCRLLGWQDTLMVNNGRQYFKDCYIEGRVDFIYGSGAAVFETCEIHSKNGGYVTAASTPQDHPYGFVFLRCKLTGDEAAWDPATTNPATTQKAKSTGKLAFLGRPWRDYAAVTFIECDLGDHIRPEGWDNWRKPEKEKTSRYSEYGSTGPGGDMTNRVGWAKRLTKAEADAANVVNVLGGSDGWKPDAE